MRVGSLLHSSLGCLDFNNALAFEIGERVNTSLCTESVQSEEVTFTSWNKVHVAAQRVKMKTIARVFFSPGLSSHPPVTGLVFPGWNVSQAQDWRNVFKRYLHSAIKVSHVPDFPML